ncbi:MAG: response regulator [bacterium]
MKKRILVVDDDPDMADSIASLLKDEGFETTYVLNGNEAIKKVSEFQPEVILLDIAMPGMDGYDTLKSLKKEGLKSPIIIITAYRDGTMNERALACLKEGAYTVIYKPFDPEELISLLKEAL